VFQKNGTSNGEGLPKIKEGRHGRVNVTRGPKRNGEITEAIKNTRVIKVSAKSQDRAKRRI